MLFKYIIRLSATPPPPSLPLEATGNQLGLTVSSEAEFAHQAFLADAISFSEQQQRNSITSSDGS